MSLKTKMDSQVAADVILNQIASILFDSWIVMLCLGGLSHKLAIPKLAIGYGTSLLVFGIVVACTFQGHQTNTRLKAISKQLEDRK